MIDNKQVRYCTTFIHEFGEFETSMYLRHESGHNEIFFPCDFLETFQVRVAVPVLIPIFPGSYHSIPDSIRPNQNVLSRAVLLRSCYEF